MATSEDDIVGIVRDVYSAWTERDMDAFFANIHDNMVYVLHLDPAVVAMGGEHRGRIAFRSVLDRFRDTFIYLRFDRTRFKRSGSVVSLRVDYSCLHKASRQILSSSYLAEVTVCDRLIVRIEEFPDTGFVEAFFRFNAAVAASASSQDPA